MIFGRMPVAEAEGAILAHSVALPGRSMKKGRVLSVVPGTNRVIVEGVNLIKRHTRPNPQKNIKGGIVERESSLSMANVQLVCPECGSAARVGRKLLDDGRRVRYCVKCKGVVDR